MALHTTTDVAEVRDLLSAALAADPVANTIYTSILASLERDDAAPWAAHPHGDPLAVAARSQAHTPVALTPSWDDVSELAGALAVLDPPVAAVAAEPTVVDALVTAIGRTPTGRMDERLFRLDELIPPAGVEGAARPAGPDDLDLLAEWFTAFVTEAFGRLPRNFDASAEVRRAQTRSTCWLWTVSGTPVSFANRHPTAYGAARVGPVYTPPALRRRGYGSAATAAASRHILDEGAVPCLYTDLANPTSNKIYEALGFRPVLDRCEIRFD